MVPATLNGLFVTATTDDAAELFPHKFEAVTLIVPELAFALKVIELVFKPFTIVQPDG